MSKRAYDPVEATLIEDAASDALEILNGFNAGGVTKFVQRGNRLLRLRLSVVEDKDKESVAPATVDSSSPQTVLRDPTPHQIHSACLSYRHDFGLMSTQNKSKLEGIAIEWLRAWQKEGVI